VIGVIQAPASGSRGRVAALPRLLRLSADPEGDVRDYERDRTISCNHGTKCSMSKVLSSKSFIMWS
jgi:hypothetical protein